MLKVKRGLFGQSARRPGLCWSAPFCIWSIVVLVSCSGSNGPAQIPARPIPPPSTLAIDACALVTISEAEEIVAAPILEESLANNNMSCIYTGQAEDGDP